MIFVSWNFILFFAITHEDLGSQATSIGTAILALELVGLVFPAKLCKAWKGYMNLIYFRDRNRVNGRKIKKLLCFKFRKDTHDMQRKRKSNWGSNWLKKYINRVEKEHGLYHILSFLFSSCHFVNLWLWNIPLSNHIVILIY